MMISLTPNGIPFMFTSPPKVQQPLLQLIDVVKLHGVTSQYIVSDGKFHCKALLEPEVQDRFKDSLKRNVLFQILSFQLVDACERVIYIKNICIIATGMVYRIGDPTAMEKQLNEIPSVVPIHSLRSHSSMWTILCRVTAKTGIRSSKRKVNGQPIPFFYFDVIDKHAGQIRIACLGPLYERFYQLINIHQVFTISGGNLIEPNRYYNKLPHEFEIRVTSTTVIHPAIDDGSIPMKPLEFKEIQEIRTMPQDSTIDFIGLVVGVGEIINSPGTNKTIRRTILLEDNTGRVELSMYGKFCYEEGEKLKTLGELAVVAFESASVEHYKGISFLTTVPNTRVWFQTDFPEADTIKDYRKRCLITGRSSTSTSRN